MPLQSLLVSPCLAQAGFRHGFSTRALDLRQFEGGDDGYRARLAAFADAAGIVAPIQQVRQVHGSLVREAGTDGPAEADALVAAAPHAVGVRVADCVPVLAADPVTGRVAAIHAGWRGLVAGVVERGLRALLPGDVRSRVLVAVGPCIGGCCFEVSAEVAQQIGHVIWRSPDGAKARVDLRGAVTAAVQRAAPGAVMDQVDGCTRCAASRFFSYRREGESSGRHLAAIAARGSVVSS